jgi:hypothetical protein
MVKSKTVGRDGDYCAGFLRKRRAILVDAELNAQGLSSMRIFRFLGNAFISISF